MMNVIVYQDDESRDGYADAQDVRQEILDAFGEAYDVPVFIEVVEKLPEYIRGKHLGY